MAKKLTKHIRLVEYNNTSNQFEIAFHLEGENELFGLRVTYDFDRDIIPTNYTAETFEMLGFSTSDVDNILGEIFDWMNQPRARLADQSYGDLMRARIDLTKRIGKERRTKVAVERIVAEAPPLDWAMSVTEELVDELEKHGHPIKAVQAVLTRISAMQAVGLGEEPAKVEIADGWELAPTDDRPTMFVDALNSVLPRLVDDVGANLGYLFEIPPLDFDRRNLMDAFRHTFEDAFKIATADRSQQSNADEENRYHARRLRADDATDKAVNAIHTHARRYLTPMSMREHNFLRSIIKQEIEWVVRGVL